MEHFLEGQTAIVTGGTRGIGRAIAKVLLDAGAGVLICGRSEESLRKAVASLGAETGGKVQGKLADVRNSEDVVALFQFVDDWIGAEQLGALGILVNNAGVGIYRSVAELTPVEWKEVVETNLNGAFYCAHEALARFRNRGGGYIINISSLAGRNAFAGGAAYNASKFGMNGFSEAAMLDHRHENVRVTYVMPGSVNTGFGSGSAGADWKIAPEDIGEIVLMLLRMPDRTLVSRVEVRPLRPKK
jgi:NAD(P)-dependent dehydrogenase (short-subunit alcohol dehydrogenase family)